MPSRLWFGRLYRRNKRPSPSPVERARRVAGGLAAGILSHWGVVLSTAAGAILMSASTIIVAVNAQLLKRADLDAD